MKRFADRKAAVGWRPAADRFRLFGFAAFLLAILPGLLGSGRTRGAERSSRPLRELIDERVDAELARRKIDAPPIASDAEFLRRVCLDLVGRIPTAQDARAFLSDASPSKRSGLVGRLLDSPEYARHMQYVFDVMLMERRPDQRIGAADWQDYLYRSFRDNKPFDQLAREILSADGSDPPLRPAAKFYLDRDGDLHALTRDIGRLFLGMNLQCAQCHDHPLIDDYLQQRYYGIYAFLTRSFLFTDSKTNQVFFAEKADGEATFQSVFKKKNNSPQTAQPHLPSGDTVREVKLPPGDEYWVGPNNNTRPIPKQSRRTLLGQSLTTGKVLEFNRNIVNRLWALMIGRGLVHPPDMHHIENPPADSELLDDLATWFAQHRFDIRAFLYEVAMSGTYQGTGLAAQSAAELPGEGLGLVRIKPLRPESLALSVMQATGFLDAERLAAASEIRSRDPKFGAVLCNHPGWFERALHARLAGNIAPFVTKFGGTPGQAEDFQATLDQALFVSNGGLIRSWLVPRPGNLTQRLGEKASNPEIAVELYLSVLTRFPTNEECAEVDQYLKLRFKEREQALQELVWALIASVEFRFNH